MSTLIGIALFFGCCVASEAARLGIGRKSGLSTRLLGLRTAPGPTWKQCVALVGALAGAYLYIAVVALLIHLSYGMETGAMHYRVTETHEGFDAHGKLLPDDRLVTIDGQPVSNTDGAPAWNPVAEIIQDRMESGATSVQIEVLRAGEPVLVTVTPGQDDPSEGFGPRYRIGVVMAIEPERTSPGLDAVGPALAYPANEFALILGELHQFVVGGVEGELAGPVGIAPTLSEASEVGMGTFFMAALPILVYLTFCILLLFNLIRLGLIVFDRRDRR